MTRISGAEASAPSMEDLTEMKVECHGHRGTDLPVHEVDRFGTEHTAYDVSVGREYRVYAMSLGEASLAVLIADDTEKPGWYPLSLF